MGGGLRKRENFSLGFWGGGIWRDVGEPTGWGENGGGEMRG